MHKFFITNNLGGGGTNVSRFVVYKDLLQTNNIGILLNYYYINPNIPKSISFDQPVLRRYTDFNSIHDFLNYVKDSFKERGRSSSEYDNNQPNLSSEYLLDSGGGNLIRDLINQDVLEKQHVDELINPYHNFAQDLAFDYVILLDYALKYTYKAGERGNSHLVSALEELAQNKKKNLFLLERSLHNIKSRDSFTPITIAPLHGVNIHSFEEYIDDILDLEANVGQKIGGFALGGIADTRRLENSNWGVPMGFSSNPKSAWLVSNLVKRMKNKIPKRPLHVLGAGNIYALPFLIKAGATSSDCHSSWRRASEPGSKGFPKYLIPLFNRDLDFLDNSNEVYSYKDIGGISNVKCDCPICEEYSLDDLKIMYANGAEDTYFSKLLIYFHAVYQYEYLIQFIQKHPTDYIGLLTNTPDYKLNYEYLFIANSLGL